MSTCLHLCLPSFLKQHMQDNQVQSDGGNTFTKDNWRLNIIARAQEMSANFLSLVLPMPILISFVMDTSSQFERHHRYPREIAGSRVSTNRPATVSQSVGMSAKPT